MRIPLTLAVVMLGTGIAAAQEAGGCDKTKFPIDRERAALTAPNLPALVSGGEVAAATATTIKLRPLADAGLSKPPERDQKSDKFAGTLNFASPGGTYAIAVADYAWIDVLQKGNYLKPKDHNSLKGCVGVRKVMKFDLSTGPAVIQLSGVVDDAIKLVIFRAAD